MEDTMSWVLFAHALRHGLLRPRSWLKQPVVALVLCALASPAAEQKSSGLPPAANRPVDFAKDVQPLLSRHCYSCHGPDKQKADLRWDSKDSLSKVGDHGPILKPGDSAGSRVVALVAGLDPESVMPPKGERLTEAEIGLLRSWIDQGGHWPESAGDIAQAKRNHWA